jgi:hypothetical protein
MLHHYLSNFLVAAGALLTINAGPALTTPSYDAEEAVQDPRISYNLGGLVGAYICLDVHGGLVSTQKQALDNGFSKYIYREEENFPGMFVAIANKPANSSIKLRFFSGIYDTVNTMCPRFFYLKK